jgi:hypothetical protein
MYNDTCSGSCKPDSRCCLSKVHIWLWKPQGVGILEWGGNGEGMEMGRTVYEQPGTKVDGILSQQGGFQVSKGKRKGSKRNEKREKQKARGLRHNALFILYSCT